jgi:circadian clock protein KaiC
MRMVCTTPEILLADVDQKGTVLDGLVREMGARRLVIDSMSHFEFSGKAPGELREQLGGFVNHLRLLKVTTLMTHEIAQIVGPTVTLSSYGLEFLADNLIVLRYVELEGEMQKACNVLKFRGGAHDRKYRLLELADEGVIIRSDFSGIENISGGTARRSVAQRVRRMV